jgi:tripartite-type tricarboxylate transporter receptor subunit TctC
MVHVPFSANPLPDLISGQVQVFFAAIPAAIGNVRAGAVRALAVTTAARSSVLPDVPTVGEFVPGFEASGWNGFGAPKNTPAEIIERLNAAVRDCVADPAVSRRIIELGNAPLATSVAGFGEMMRADTAKWGRVVTSAKITLQ